MLTEPRFVAEFIGHSNFASQTVMPVMLAQGGGRIVHVASQFGTVSGPNQAVYGLTKAALIHLARSMAVELGPGTSWSTPLVPPDRDAVQPRPLGNGTGPSGLPGQQRAGATGGHGRRNSRGDRVSGNIEGTVYPRP